MKPHEKTRDVVRVIAAIAMMSVGVLHFVQPDGFVKMVPRFLPAPLVLVQVSGFFEVLGGIGLLVPRLRRAAGLGLVLLYIAVFPANVNMALHPQLTPSIPIWALWLRLPFQALFIWTALWVSKKE